MNFRKTRIPGVFVIEFEPIEDKRGFFTRIFTKDEFQKKLNFSIVQINQSYTSKKGTLRGLHFQKNPQSEAKIVQCLKGTIYDVVLDLRKNSPTYGEWLAEELNEKSRKLLFIPKGLAQGFQTLKNNCLVQYMMSEFYSSKYARGVRWNDPKFDIEWPISNPILSEKDKVWPLTKNE